MILITPNIASSETKFATQLINILNVLRLPLNIPNHLALLALFIIHISLRRKIVFQVATFFLKFVFLNFWAKDIKVDFLRR